MFVLFIKPVKPLNEVQAVFPAHRAFLEQHAQAGTFLVTGGLAGKPGGVVVANIASREELEALLANDPFIQQQVAEYEVIEFRLSHYHASLAPLLSKPA